MKQGHCRAGLPISALCEEARPSSWSLQDRSFTLSQLPLPFPPAAHGILQNNTPCNGALLLLISILKLCSSDLPHHPPGQLPPCFLVCSPPVFTVQGGLGQGRAQIQSALCMPTLFELLLQRTGAFFHFALKWQQQPCC